MAKRSVEAAESPKDPKLGVSFEFSQNAAEGMFATADVNRVFGRPIKQENKVIIPAAEVLWAGGFGGGSGAWDAPVNEAEDAASGAGDGSGGGGRSFARPVAVIIADEDGVRVEPIIDPTKILLAALTAGGFMAAMAMRMLSPRKALKELKQE
jgi:uncharacterized spore protein YtfJ